MVYLQAAKIGFDVFSDNEMYVTRLDCVNFIINEFRLDPSSKWHNFKSHSSGLKYEFVMPIIRPVIIRRRGHSPVSVHGITIFMVDS